MNRSIDASETLRQVLEDRHLTQEEFARANDMGIATANRWINGKVNVNERKLAKAIAAVGANPSDYGLDAAAAGFQPLTASETPPPWWDNQATTLHAKLDELLQQNSRLIAMLERMPPR